MSNIDLDRQLLRFLSNMQEGVEYVIREEIWEQYQQARLDNGWARYGDRQDYRLVRQGQQVWLNHQVLVKDLQNPPQNPTFTLAFALASAGSLDFVFAFVVGRGFVPINESESPLTDSELAVLDHAFSNLSAVYGQDLQGNPQGFYHETPDREIAGFIRRDSRVDLHLHGLTEDQTAQVLALLKGR